MKLIRVFFVSLVTLAAITAGSGASQAQAGPASLNPCIHKPVMPPWCE